jgi:hypothetical protein
MLSDDYLDSDGKPTEAGIKKFAYEKKLSQGYSTKAITTDTPSDTSSSGDEKTSILAHLGRNWYWYALGTVGVVALLVVVF